MLTNAVGYDSWPIPSVKLMQAAAPVLSRLPAAAIKPALGMLIARGHDDRSVARESLGVHYRPYAAHGGGAAMARRVSALDAADTIAVQDRLPTLRVPARVVWGAAGPVPEGPVRRAVRPRPRDRSPPYRGRQALHP